MILVPRTTPQRRLIGIALMAVLGLLTGLTVRPWLASSQPRATDSWVLRPAPPTLDIVVAEADLIVVGTIGSSVRAGSFAGYDAQGHLRTAQDAQLPPDAEVPFFDHDLKVEQVLKAGRSLHGGQIVTLRVFSGGRSNSDPATHAFPPPQPGDRHLFFLVQNPDRQSYGLRYGPAARLAIDGPVVTQTDGRRSPLPFGGSAEPAALLQQVRDIVRQHQAPHDRHGS